jgi:hypothetical protein
VSQRRETSQGASARDHGNSCETADWVGAPRGDPCFHPVCNGHHVCPGFDRAIDRILPGLMLTLPRVLRLKIFCTILFWCVPLLFFPTAWFLRLGFPAPEPLLFTRLLGAAYLALTVTYSLGLIETQKGGLATQAVWTGIISNGLACAILTFYGLTGAWSTWSMQGQLIMWSSVILTLFLTILLIPYRHR